MLLKPVSFLKKAAAASVKDDFNRADEVVEADAAWSVLFESSNATGDIVSNQVEFTTLSTNDEAAYAHSDSLAADQFAEIDVIGMDVTGSGNPRRALAVCRGSVGATSDYYSAALTYAPLLSPVWRLEINKKNSSGEGWTNLTSVTISAPTFPVKLRCETTGTSTTTIKGFLDGVEEASVTDSSSPFTSGSAGMGGYLSANTQTVTVDNFNSGNL